jgi:predicted nuclease with TOPRIM domain
MSDQKRTRKFTFGNERFGGSYSPGEFEFKFPDDMTREEFEAMFSRRMNALHRRGNDFADEFFDHKSRKEKLKPLSIRVKPHTKEFFKNHSILSPRDVLEMYENFNNGSEAFINSLIEEERQLEKELEYVQEKLHNARLFKDKLSEMAPENDVLNDEDKLLKLNQEFENSEIKPIGNESPVEKAKSDIIKDIQTYNTLIIRVYDDEILSIGVFTNAEPVVYYFKNEYSRGDVSEILAHVEEYCSEHEIEFKTMQNCLY